MAVTPAEYAIPFNRSSTAGKELQYIADTLSLGQIAGDQIFTKRCEALLQQFTGARRALLTTSCTHALELAGLLLDLQPGDEVIVPSFTFVSTANAFVLRGAKPVFVDIRPDTMNMDEQQLEGVVTDRTRAVVPVHYAGVGCEMDAILNVAARYELAVIEDNAHGLLARYRGRPLGTFGHFATQSFHETKNFTCGEGGALLINAAQYVDRAEILREKGTNRSLFFRGQVDKYSWVDVGSSYVLSDVLAAFLYGQLEQHQQIQARRRQIWDCYEAHLRDWAALHEVRLPFVPAHCEQSFHMFYLILPSLESRHALIQHLRRRGILSVFHYQPLHLSAMGVKFGGSSGECPVTERVSDTLLRLPFYNSLAQDDQSRVIQAIRDFNVA